MGLLICWLDVCLWLCAFNTSGWDSLAGAAIDCILGLGWEEGYECGVPEV